VESNSWISLAIEVDYEKTVQNIFSEAAATALAEYKGLEALSIVGDRTVRTVCDLPTWVPDFTQKLAVKALPKGKCQFCTATRFKTIFYYSKEISPYNICLEGLYYDTISATSVAHWDTEHPTKVSDLLNFILNPSPANSLNGDKLSTLIEKTLIADGYQNYSSAGYSLTAGFERWLYSQICRAVGTYDVDMKKAFIENPDLNLASVLRTIGIVGDYKPLEEPTLRGASQFRTIDQVELAERGRNALPPSLSKYLETGVDNFYDQWTTTCKFRRLFRTERGHLGLGMPSVQPGDRIYLLSGAIVPYVFRHQPKDAETVLDLEGEAYIHGIMYGEALRDSDVEFQKFTVY
jgi:hypothetical protein